MASSLHAPPLGPVVADVCGGLEPARVPLLAAAATDAGDVGCGCARVPRFTYITDSIFPEPELLRVAVLSDDDDDYEGLEELDNDEDVPDVERNNNRNPHGKVDTSDHDPKYCSDAGPVRCSCVAACSASTCECVQQFGNFSTSAHGIALAPARVLPLVECGPACACAGGGGAGCGNRLTQLGVRAGLYVQRGPRGFGLHALAPLGAGTFVSLYAGEVLSTVQARARWAAAADHADHADGEGNYVLSVRQTGWELHIDPREKGNVGRFLNHACEPSCVVWPVRWGSDAVPRAAIFTLCDVEEDDELTFDYGDAGQTGDVDLLSGVEGRTPCLCGSARCRGWLPFDPTL
ncbi:hypothetical protein Q5752_000339 [Cryptotrichosporon argae]